MKSFPLVAIVLVLGTATTTYAATVPDNESEASTNEEHLETAASSLDEAHKQEKRYIGGAWDPYSSRLGLGLDGGSLYNTGYGGYGSYSGLGAGASALGGYGGYGGYGNYGGYGSAGYGPYAGYGSPYSYYNARFGSGSYPYSRLGYNYPSSYYGGYSSSVVGNGLGALGGGVVPPVGVGSGYQYGPGISGTVY
ncbi:keratin-associated protein 19-2 [Eurosta solidaginis]|uniref:keratin-associated protein 19-2 n=1 Tax=Eurosta solidaginis TaxID=178769 RepID=UPI003530CEFD